ncbi:MAG: hypothetical protein PSN34_07015 [Urechidicola sp.]|nr:hypothetical protein [Urechidicola sp.]
MKKAGWLIVLAIVVLSAVITNPKEEEHTSKLAEMMIDVMVEQNDKDGLVEGNGFLKGMGSYAVGIQLKEYTNYKNYVLLSTLEGESGGTISIGVFGNIIPLFDKEWMRKRSQQSNPK